MQLIDQMNYEYHTPVLLTECISGLDINPNGVYVDVTYGGGGHSKPILDRLTAKGRLFGFDHDDQAVANTIDDERFVFVKSNYEYVAHFMSYYGVGQVDGILADLGVSSFHFDEPSRGFSYRFDTDLDMRMNESIS
ncbi:MAG: 16S rRNA (cytosine(1402)-N(4))-methyltransferase, partial [Bacteroidota bacterium]